MAVLNNDTQVSIFVDGLDHPEGIAWGTDGYVYAGGEAGQIYRIDMEGREFREIANTGGFVAGLAIDANHNIYACEVGSHTVKRVSPDGTITTYSTGARGEPFRIPNYPVFDSQSNLYVSDSGDMNQNNGHICKIPPCGGEGVVWERSLVEFPNGMCLSPKGDYLYVVISFKRPGVSRVEIRPDGSAGAVETVVELPENVPDGLAFDTEDNLYISCYRPDRIYRLSPSGKLDTLAEELTGHLLSAPTNVAFCGRERNIFLSTNLGRWHLTRYELGATGVPLHYPTF